MFQQDFTLCNTRTFQKRLSKIISSLGKKKKKYEEMKSPRFKKLTWEKTKNNQRQVGQDRTRKHCTVGWNGRRE